MNVSSVFARAAVVLPLFLLAAGASGCVSKPTMQLRGAEINGVEPAIPPLVRMTVVLDVKNPNSYDVAVRAMRGTVTMGGKYTLPIQFQAPEGGIWLAAKRTSPLRVPVAIPMDLALILARDSAFSPTIPFRVVGTADVTGTRSLKIEEDNYAVDEKGEMTQAQVLAVLPNTFLGGVR